MVRAEDLMTYENQLLAQGYKYICGVDEVGRGPLAGPVCVAAVIMPMDNLIQGINDSKKVAKAKREKLYEQIKENAIAYSIQMVDNFKIDEINILNATKQAMHDAICSLKVNPDIVLIDAAYKTKLIDDKSDMVEVTSFTAPTIAGRYKLRYVVVDATYNIGYSEITLIVE